MPKLYIKEGVNKGCYFDLNPNGKTVVGRSSSCDIKLKDLDASRRHAEITISPEGIAHLRDLESKNGTYLNECRVSESPVKENDNIRIGNTICIVVHKGQSLPGAQPVADQESEKQATLLSAKAVTSPVASKLANPWGSKDSQVPKPLGGEKKGWEKIEGGATIMSLKREDFGKMGLSGMRKSSSGNSPPSVDSTVHTMIDLKSSSALLKQKEINDVNQLKKSHTHLATLYEVANTVCANLNLDDVLNSIMKLVFKVLRPDSAFILLYNEETDELEPKVYLTKQGNATKSKITYSRTIIQQAIEQDSAVLSSDAATDDRFSGMQSIINYSIRSAMCVPLKYQEKLLGVLQIDNRLASGAFKQSGLELLTSICNLASMAIENARLFENIQIEARRRSDFERFLSPGVVEQVMKGEVTMAESGEGIATILFSDIRAFTSMSEKMTASQMVSQLNEYFEEMTASIFDHQGTVDKFIGDAIMSVFGVPSPQEDDHIRAVICAIDMQKRLVEINHRWTEQGKPIFKVGIGINTGKVMLGNIGSERRMEFTVIGDHVNIASRLCGKADAGQIIISEYNYPSLKEHFQCEPMGEVSLKGKEKALKLYRIVY